MFVALIQPGERGFQETGSTAFKHATDDVLSLASTTATDGPQGL